MRSKTIDVEDVLSKLTVSEKVSLLSGTDFWHTSAIPRLNVPAIRVTDGPNGVRGTQFFNGVPAACFPCGTALGATWDTELIRTCGALQGEEAIAKGASVILGPTVNMQRSPLGGRGFESFAEDPFLAGAMGAAIIQGIQSTGVAATIKHFVCNDGEDERQSVNAIVSERALREIYLMPFQIVQRDAKPIALMTAYNRLNGLHCSESPRLLQSILRDEWGFDGLVMSDWFGTYSTSESIKAGLDLEMPGPSYTRGKLVMQALSHQKLFESDIDERVRQVLKLVQRVQPLGLENAPEATANTAETSQTLRTVGASSIVLMKNENNTLPFKKDKTIAVIGPNAKFAAYCGGGSAALRPYYAITPYEGIKAQAKDVKYKLGAFGYQKLPVLSNITKDKDGKKGITMTVFLEPPSDPKRQPVEELYVDNSDMMLADYKSPNLPSSLYYIEFTATLTPEESGDYDFSLAVAGTAKLYIDGELIVDNETQQTPGTSFFGVGTIEELGSKKLEEGRTYNVMVKFGTFPTTKLKKVESMDFGAGGCRIGGVLRTDPKSEIEKAVELAKIVDQVVICAGLNSDWESEGHDRTHMALPANSDELISAICAANPSTAVVVQSGTPVAMPWLSSAPAILQAWYGGNETGNAIADILFGEVNPSAKLPLTYPIRNEDNPAFLNFKSEWGRTLYGEDVYIGYRYYEKKAMEVAFPFGHGLSYTQFEMKDLKVAASSAEEEITISADVTNTGSVAGAQVVQVYVAQQAPSVNRPPKELKGFTKVSLAAGETKLVKIAINKKYAASFWDERRNKWIMEKDRYEVLVGDSSANMLLRGQYFEVDKTKWWVGV